MAVDITHALRNKMIGTPAITGTTGTRIYVDQAPSILDSAVFPQIVIQLEDMDRLRHTDAVDELARVELTITSYSDERGEMVDLMAAIRNALDHFRGVLGTAERAIVHGIWFIERRLFRERLSAGGEFGPFRGEQDIIIRFQET
jgi:hypothetical protein